MQKMKIGLNLERFMHHIQISLLDLSIIYRRPSRTRKNEIEASKTPKYMVGDFINASILGCVGIVVVPAKLCKEALRIRKYLIGASEIKKIGDIAKNTIIVEYRQFMDRLGDGGEGKRL